MLIRDYNGTGIWSEEAILQRYQVHAMRFGVNAPLDLHGIRHQQGDDFWVYPALEQVIAGIKAGDPACIELGVELVETDQTMSFGKIFKSNTARELRRSILSAEQKERLRLRISNMLIQIRYLPHEYRQYARLLVKIGFEDYWQRMHSEADLTNPWTARRHRYFELHHAARHESK